MKKVKIPFLNRAPQTPAPPPMSKGEADALKATVARLEKENEEWEADLIKMAQKNR